MLSQPSDSELLDAFELFARGASTPSTKEASMLSDVDRITAEALLALGDHMDDLDRHAGAAIRRYVERSLAGKPGTPHGSGLSSDAWRLARECAADALALERRRAA